MVITIKKGDTKKEIQSAIKKVSKKNKKSQLSDFYGKLKNKYGDGLTYQKETRNEWD